LSACPGARKNYLSCRAVAENQPFQTKNRMTSELTSFATRLGAFMAECHAVSGAQSGHRASDQQFNTLALDLFARQFALNAAYRRICEARGVTPGSIEHWSCIPAVPAAAFKELELTCLLPEQRTAVFHSSGTTGQSPSRHVHGTESLELYRASLWPWFERHVLPDRLTNSAKLLFLTPRPTVAPHSSLVHMFECIRVTCGAEENSFLGELSPDGAWSLNVERVASVLCRAEAAHEPVTLLGTAFNFVHLLDGLAERGLSLVLPTGSRVMETGGYKGRSRELSKDALHTLIEQRLGVPRSGIICEYGMSELSSQAYDGIAGTANSPTSARTFRFPPWCRVQLVSPETALEVAEGQTGLVRLFDLANAWSVLAVQTEDLAIRRGDGFELKGRAVAAEPRGCSLMAQP
jgi:hypothetical protein